MCMSRRVHPHVCLKEAMIPPPFANSVKVKSIHPFQGWVLQLLSSSLALLFCEIDNMILKFVSYSWSKRVFFKIIRKMQTTFQLVPRDVQLRAWPMEAVARAEGHAEVRPAALLRDVQWWWHHRQQSCSSYSWCGRAVPREEAALNI